MSPDRNVVAQAYGLTAFFPVADGRADDLERRLETLDNDASPLGRLEQLHFARLHVLRDLVYQGPPQEPDPLQRPYLVFTATFDGTLERFLADLSARLPEEVDSVWSHCVGYPGGGDAAAFATYVRECQIENGYIVAAYPGATVQDVRRGLALRERVADLASRSRGLDDAELQREFLAGLGERP